MGFVARTLEQLGNYLKRDKKPETVKKEAKAAAKEAPISQAMPEDRRKFLEYGLTFLKTEKLIPLMHARIGGASNQQIASYYKVPVSVVERAERMAIDEIKREIAKARVEGTPLLGGLN